MLDCDLGNLDGTINVFGRVAQQVESVIYFSFLNSSLAVGNVYPRTHTYTHYLFIHYAVRLLR